MQGSNNAPGAEQVLLYLFQNRGSFLWWTFNFVPSGLYAGGDPTAIPAELRPFFNLRTMQVTVALNGGCSKSQLQVSGDGVTVIGARPETGGECLVTLDVASGQTGVRDLTVLANPPESTGSQATVDQTLAKAVDLSNAIPVVPAFLLPTPATSTK
jgi:hypothetical protein